MKPSIYLLASGMLLVVTANSQTPDFSQWLKTITIEGKSVTVLRADELKFPSTILGHITNAQMLLKDLKHIYKSSMGDSYNPNFGIIHSCEEIEKVDKTFPTHYYREELKAYQDVYDAIKQKQEDEKKALMAQREAEELRSKIISLKAGKYWINRDSINVRSKPNTQSMIIGQIHRLSYVTAFEVEGKPDWAEISFGKYDGEYTGFVLGKYIADDWDELTLTAEDSAVLISGRKYNFVANEANLARMRQAEEAQQQRVINGGRSGSGRKYILGPRGGCYFINSHGNREYVDRSYCR